MWAHEAPGAVVLAHDVRLESAALLGGVAATCVRALEVADAGVRQHVSGEVGAVGGPVRAAWERADARLFTRVRSQVAGQRAAVNACVAAARLRAVVRSDIWRHDAQ